MSTTELPTASPSTFGIYFPAKNPALEIPATATTLAGFRRWACSDDFPERGRITFYEGRLIVDMSPERYESHIYVKSGLNHALENLVRSQDLGIYYPDGAMIVNESADVSNEPDAMFATWATLESGKLAPPENQANDGTYMELEGTPDWVCEIVSDSSVPKDTRTLREAYHKAEVAEYWLIDARGPEIDFQLLVREAGGYTAAPANEGWRRSPVFNREFQLTRQHDRLGRWRYDLKHREISSR